MTKGATDGISPVHPETASDAMLVVRERVRFYNTSDPPRPVTIKLLYIDLKAKGIELSERTLNRWMYKIGFRFKQGPLVNRLHESVGVVALRDRYLRLFREIRGTGELPSVPVVVLDESYVNQCGAPCRRGRGAVPV